MSVLAAMFEHWIKVINCSLLPYNYQAVAASTRITLLYPLNAIECVSKDCRLQEYLTPRVRMLL
jgi:hypothetical protein